MYVRSLLLPHAQGLKLYHHVKDRLSFVDDAKVHTKKRRMKQRHAPL